jgi:hypothetical protein
MFQCECGCYLVAKETLLRRWTGHGHVTMPVIRFYNGPRCIECCPVCGAELWPQLATVTDYIPAADAVYVDHAGRDAKPTKVTLPVTQPAAVAVAA